MFKNIGTTWILNLLQILVMFALTRFVLETLGTAQNGVWFTIVAFTGTLSLLILGVPMASVRYIAEHVARKDLEGTNKAISTCLGICLVLGIGALLVGVALYFFFDAQYLHGPLGSGLSQPTIESARIAFMIVVGQVAFGFAMRLPYGIFDAHHDFVTRNMVMAGELVLRLSLTFGLLWWRPELPMLALVQVGCMLAEFTAMVVIVKRRYPGLRLGLGNFDKSLVKTIFGFSMFAMLLNLGTQLAFKSDQMVIGAHLDAQKAVFFEIGNKFFDPLTQFLVAVSAVVMPMTIRLKTLGEIAELRSVFLKWSKICLSIVLLIGIYLLVLGPRFLGWWVGQEYVQPSGRVLQILMVSFFFYLPVRGVALPMLMGLGKPAWPAGALLAMGVINLVLSLVLVKPLGINGVALGTAIPNVLFAISVLVFACRELKIGLGEYIGYVVSRAAVGALIPFAFVYWLKNAFHVWDFAPLVASGISMVAVFAIAWIFFVYKDDPYLDVRSEIARAFALITRRKA